jgi:hypothetical protein
VPHKYDTMTATVPNGEEEQDTLDSVDGSESLEQLEDFDKAEHEDQLERLESQKDESAEDSPDGDYQPVDPVLEIADEKMDEEEEEDVEDAYERLCAKFDFPCCGKNQPSEAIKEDVTPLETAAEPVGGETATHTMSEDDTSLADIVARMDAMDVDTAPGDTDDLSRDGDDKESEKNRNLTAPNKRGGGNLTKIRTPWFREPIYACMIVSCIVFTIAIVVMAILLATSS